MFHLAGISCRDQSLTFSVIKNQRPSTTRFRLPDHRNIQNLTELPGLHMFHFLFTRDCGPCRVLAAASHHSSFKFVSWLIWMMKLYTMTNVGRPISKGGGRSTRDLNGCLLLFKSCSMSYLHVVTDVCMGGGLFFTHIM